MPIPILPVELYHDLLERLLPQEVWPLLFVSRFFHAQAERILYNKVQLYGWIRPPSAAGELSTPAATKQNHLLHILATSPHHAQLVRSLSIRTFHPGLFPYGPANTPLHSDDWRIASVMRQVTNLRHLSLSGGVDPAQLLNLILISSPNSQPYSHPSNPYTDSFPFQLYSFRQEGGVHSFSTFLVTQPSIVEIQLSSLPTQLMSTSTNLLPNLRVLEGHSLDRLTIHLLQKPLVKLYLRGKATDLFVRLHPKLEVLKLQDFGGYTWGPLESLAKVCPNLRFIEFSAFESASTAVSNVLQTTRGLAKLHTVRLEVLQTASRWSDGDYSRLVELLFTQLPWLERVEVDQSEWKRGLPVEVPNKPTKWDEWYPRW